MEYSLIMENALPGVQGEYPRVNYTSIRPELLFTSDKEHRKDITCLPMTRRETATQHKKTDTGGGNNTPI